MSGTFSTVVLRFFDASAEPQLQYRNINVARRSEQVLGTSIPQSKRGGSQKDLSQNVKIDQWLGTLYQFPALLHARASISFDVSPELLQKTLIIALLSLREMPLAREITVSNFAGYSKGNVSFKIGIGNGEGFDILDLKEVERVLGRIETVGAFETFDTAVRLHYSILDGQRHRVHEDHYIARLIFRPGRVEVLIHHLKGMRRVDPSELVGLILHHLNMELARQRFPEAALEALTST